MQPRGTAVRLLAVALLVLMCGASYVHRAEAVASVAQWITSDWGECSRPCGGGSQNRTVNCWLATLGEDRPREQCPAKQPLPVRDCNDFPCPVRPTKVFSCNPGGPCEKERVQGGNLTMFIVQAMNLPDLDGWGVAGGETDARVNVTLYEVSASDEYSVRNQRWSEEVRNSVNPVWPDGGDRLEFGTQHTGTQIRWEVWDSDTGFEGTGELIGTAEGNVIACSKFMFEQCSEQAWLPLSSEPCWVDDGEGNEVLSTTAPCLEVRMDIVPLDIVPLEMYSSSASEFSTTIAREFTRTEASDGWGVPYAFHTTPIIAGLEDFADAAGGTIIQTDTRLSSGLPEGSENDFYARIEVNIPVRVFIFRKFVGEESWRSNRPDWLDDWEESRTKLQISQETQTYRANIRDYAPGEIILGDPQPSGLSDPTGDPMYIPVLRIIPNVEVPEAEYPKVFDRETFVLQMFQFLIPQAFLLVVLWSFYRRIRFRLDLVPTFLVSLQLPPLRSKVVTRINEELGLRSVPVKYTSEIASLWVAHLDDTFSGFDWNIEFRRNLYFATKAVQLVLSAPLVVFMAWGLSCALTVTPPSVGYGILFIGTAAWLMMGAVHVWHLEGWRMLKGVAIAFVVSFAFVFCFMIAVVFDDIAPLSHFAVTATALTLNMMPMTWIMFANHEKLRAAVANLREKSKEYGFMATGTNTKTFSALSGANYTIDPKLPGGKFKYVDGAYRLFSMSEEDLHKNTRRAYAVAWLILLAQAIAIGVGADENATQGLATLITVSALDVVVYLLHRGRISLSPGFLVGMQFVARAFITAFVGEFWLAGHGLAYFTFGIVLGLEIVGRRLPVMSGQTAGAVAYFGWEEKKSGAIDIAGSPEFCLGALSFTFLLLLVASVFAFPADEIPSIEIGTTVVPVWVFGVAAFLLVLVICTLNGTMRSFHLEKRGILKVHAYLGIKAFTLPYMLACVTEILLVCSGLLMFAVTGSSFVLELVVFLPLIIMFGARAYSQWVKNDYAIFEDPMLRVSEEERARLQEERDELDAVIAEDDADEERDPAKLAAWESRKAGNVTAGVDDAGGGAGLAMSSKNHVALPPLQRTEDAEDEAAAVAAMPAMPILPMAGPDGTIGSVRRINEEKGTEDDSKEGPGDGETKEDPAASGDAKPPAEAAKPPPLRRKQTGFMEKQRKKYRRWYLSQKDPTTMSVLNACLRCKLSRTDVVTVLSLVGCLGSIFLMGLVVAAVEEPFWMGHALWLACFVVVFTIAPIIKYFNTYRWSKDMIISSLVGWSIFIGALFGLWADVMDADINNDLTLYLFTLLIMYPTVLQLGSAIYMWKDQEWEATWFVRFSMPFCSFFTAIWILLMYVFADAYFGFSLTLLYCGGVVVMTLLRVWASEGFYLPPSYRFGLDMLMLTCTFLAVVVGLFADLNLFYCFSIAFIFVALRSIGRAISLHLNRPPDSPLFFSQYIFPIYSYDPETHNIVSENAWGKDVAVGLTVVFLWGVFAAIFESPVGLGLAIMSGVLVTLVVFYGYTATDTLRRLGDSTRFFDEAMLRHASEDAEHVFDDRRVPFKILCHEFALRDEREEALEAKLAKYAAGNARKDIDPLREIRPRKTAAQWAHILHQANWNLKYRERTEEEVAGEKKRLDDEADINAALAANKADAGAAKKADVKPGQVAPEAGADLEAGGGKGGGDDAKAAVPAAPDGMRNRKKPRRPNKLQRMLQQRREREALKPFVKRPDALYGIQDVCHEITFKGSGPLGFVCCAALPYRAFKLYCGDKKRNSAKKYDASEEDDDGAAQVAQCEDSAAVLRKMWVEEAHLAIEYYEEMRLAAHFTVLLLVAAEAKLRTEAVLFQKFLREYRFKLMANGVHPPEDIFRTQSYATVDVHLVATWMQSLTPEQRERFRQLKERFTLEVNEQYKQRLIHDQEEAEASEALLAERRPREHQMYQKRMVEFQTRRIARRKEARDVHNEPESVLNEKEFLSEVEKQHYYCQEGMHGRDHQFHDPEFPATFDSIGQVQRIDMVKGWRVASGININAGLFRDGTDPDDVYQGQLADGWLLSAISIVAASGGVGDGGIDELIARLFVTTDTTETGVYGVRIYKNAQWETVWLDDFFPVLDNKYKTTRCAGAAFAYSDDFNELWVPLIEKAFAKYYGTYADLERGYVHHALQDLTGAVADEIFLAEASRGASKMRLWNKLMTFKLNGFLLGAGTVLPASSDRELMDSGLVFGAAYVIYDVRHVDGLRLLKLRNPPGDHGEWQGDWGDDSPLWTKRLKAKLGYAHEDDGCFWMSFDDFCLAFRSLYVCKYYDPTQWRHYTRSSWWKGATAVGLPNKHNPNCKVWNNPQFSVVVDRPIDVNVRLQQSYPDLVLHSTPHPVAVYFVAQGDGTTGAMSHHSLADPEQDGGANQMDEVDDMLGRGREVEWGSEDDVALAERVRRLTNTNVVAHSGPPVREREISFSTTLKPGVYTVLVGCYQQSMEGPFTLDIHTNHPIKFRQMWPPGQDEEDEADMNLREKLREKKKKAKAKAREKVREKMKIKDEEDEEEAKEEAEAEAAVAAMQEAADFMEKAKKESEVGRHSAWIESYDVASDRTYYYNMETGASQWEVPEELKTSGLMEGTEEEKVTYSGGAAVAATPKKKKKKHEGPKCSICRHSKPKGMKEDTHRLWGRGTHRTTDLLECAGGCGAVVHPLCQGYTDDRPPPDRWVCPLCAEDEEDDDDDY